MAHLEGNLLKAGGVPRKDEPWVGGGEGAPKTKCESSSGIDDVTDYDWLV